MTDLIPLINRMLTFLKNSQCSSIFGVLFRNLKNYIHLFYYSKTNLVNFKTTFLYLYTNELILKRDAKA